jgi:hypothetical protein
MDKPSLYTFFIILSGLSWTYVYFSFIYRGFKDKACGMPFWALAFNFSWELIYSLIFKLPSPQDKVNLVWFIFDIVILVIFFIYYEKQYPGWKKQYFYPYAVFAIAGAFLVLFSAQKMFPAIGEYTYGRGPFVSAYMMNVMMSIFFLERIVRTKKLDGISMYMAIAKMIGSIAPAAKNLVFAGQYDEIPPYSEWFFIVLYVMMVVFDGLFVFMLYREFKKQGLNPWKRV